MSDLLRKASNGSGRPVVTSLALPKTAGSNTGELTSSTNWNTTTDVDVIIYRRQLNSSTGQYERVSGSQTEWVGRLTGTTLAGLILRGGTEPVSGYAADGNTVVLCGAAESYGDDLYAWGIAHANQDGSLKTAAVQAALNIGAGGLNGWNPLAFPPNTVTHLGNRSYQCVINGQDLTSTLSAGMRLRTTRTVAAPTQCTTLNGTNQYWNKSAPAGMTFTDDFVISAWVKLSSYANGGIVSRYNGTNGWLLKVTSGGLISFEGYAGVGNISYMQSVQSLPLNRWVHITVQLDMSSFSATPTTSYIMLDGVDIPAIVNRAGTNPTALVQAGNLEIGSYNGGTNPFPGKIAQAAVFSAKVTEATMQGYISQGLLGTETSLISAYAFNGNANDLNTTNANNLTSNNGVAATTADAPWGYQAGGAISSTLDYSIVQKVTFSTNTTVILQVPEGCTIPTIGGVSSVAYSPNKTPYGFPAQRGKWDLVSILRTQTSLTSNAAYGSFASNGYALTVPIGEWDLGYDLPMYNVSTATVAFNLAPTAPTGLASGAEDIRFTAEILPPSAATTILPPAMRRVPQSLTASQVWILYSIGATSSAGLHAASALTQLIAENAYV